MRCATLNDFARRATVFASAADSGRRPWSTVTATSFGPRRSCARQRAARTMSAVESGPPDTASTSAGHDARSANSFAASADETGGAFAAAGSAADTLLFPLDALLHIGRGAGIFAADFDEGGAGRILLLERRQRLSEPHERVGRLAGFLELGRDRKERFGGLAEALALEQALAEPVVRLRDELVVRIFAQETAEIVFRQRIILAQQVPIGGVVL